MLNTHLLSEAKEALQFQQPKFRRGKTSSLILEESGEYQQTLREKYTGQTGSTFRRSLETSRDRDRDQSFSRRTEGRGYLLPSASDSDSEGESLGNDGLHSVTVVTAPRKGSGSGSGGEEFQRDSLSRTSTESEGGGTSVSPAVSPTSIRGAGFGGLGGGLSSPFSPQAYAAHGNKNSTNGNSNALASSRRLSQENPVFTSGRHQAASTKAGTKGGHQQGQQGSHRIKVYQEKHKALRRSPAQAQSQPSQGARTPDPLTAALREEEELMMSEEQQKGAGAGMGMGRLLHENESGADAKAKLEDQMPILATPNEKHPKRQNAGNMMHLFKRNSSFDFTNLLDEDQKLASLLRPCSRKKLLRCRVVRMRGLVGSYPILEMHLDGAPGVPDDKTLLLCARKRKKSKSSYYLISTKRDELTRESDGYIAKLRGNILGSEYTLYRRSRDTDENVGEGEELLVIKYRQTVMRKEGGPREMTAIFTDPSFTHHPNANKDLLAYYKELKEASKSGLKPGQAESEKAQPPLVVLRSLEPQWREDLQSYVLDFKGRVTEASVKNFVMEESSVMKPTNSNVVDSVTPTEEGRLSKRKEVVIFGKRGKNEFSLDMACPCSILQAFALAIASTDFKMVNSL